jgi:hypothetical protein
LPQHGLRVIPLAERRMTHPGHFARLARRGAGNRASCLALGRRERYAGAITAASR